MAKSTGAGVFGILCLKVFAVEPFLEEPRFSSILSMESAKFPLEALASKMMFLSDFHVKKSEVSQNSTGGARFWGCGGGSRIMRIRIYPVDIYSINHDKSQKYLNPAV